MARALGRVNISYIPGFVNYRAIDLQCSLSERRCGPLLGLPSISEIQSIAKRRRRLLSHDMTNTMRATGVMLCLLLMSCRPQLPTASLPTPLLTSTAESTPTTHVSPTVISSPPVTALFTQELEGSSPPPIAELGRTLLLMYQPIAEAWLSDIWLVIPDSQSIVPFRTHNANVAYCCGRWSPNGQQIAYVQTSIDDSASSLWISRADGSGNHQVGLAERRESSPEESLLPGVQIIYPWGWTADGSQLVLSFGDDVNAMDSETGKLRQLDIASVLSGLDIEVVTASAHFAAYVPATNELVLYGKRENRFVFAIWSMESDDHGSLITPPADYMPVHDPGREVALSPDGRYVALTDYDRTTVQERLWILDRERDSWRLAISRPAAYLPDTVQWSDDQKWIAWSYSDRDLQVQFPLYVAFYNVELGSLASEFAASDNTTFVPNTIVGWTTSATGKAAFAILESPGRGLILLDPNGNAPSIVMSNAKLEALLPFAPETMTTWAWQPWPQ